MAIRNNGALKDRLTDGAADGDMVVIPRPNVIEFTIPIRGIAPLVISAMSAKVLQAIAGSGKGSRGSAKLKKAMDAPEVQYNASRYISTEGWDGVNAASFRAAIIDAARMVDGVTMTALKQAVFICADGQTEEGVQLVRIHGERTMFSNVCRTKGRERQFCPRYRPRYEPWACHLRMRVNGHLLTRDSAVNLVALAGQFCGVGEWRPTATESKTGSFGLWEIGEQDGG